MRYTFKPPPSEKERRHIGDVTGGWYLRRTASKVPLKMSGIHEGSEIPLENTSNKKIVASSLSSL